MKVSKNKVALLSLAVAGLFAASAAQAQVTLTAAGTNLPAASYASEIAFPVAGATFQTGVTQNTTGVIGIGASGGQNRYYRFDVSNATMASSAFAIGNPGGAPPYAVPPALATPGNSVGPVTPAFLNPTATNVTIVASGTNYVVYQATAVAGGIAVSDNFAFVAAYTLPIAASAKLTMTTHETLVSATTQPNVTLLQTLSGTVISFLPALNFSMNNAKSEVIAATSTPTAFTRFCNEASLTPAGAVGSPGTAGCANSAIDSTAIMAGVSAYGLNAGRLTLAGVVITDVNTFSTGGTLVVTPVGSTFANAASVSFGSIADGNCNPAAVVQLGATFPQLGAATILPVTFATSSFAFTTAVGTTNPGGAATFNRAVCSTVNATSNVPGQTFNTVFTSTPNGAAYIADVISTTGAGVWVRDGAELQSPWFNFAATGFISRFFFMNTGTAAAHCTSIALGELNSVLTAGSAATTGFDIPAGGQVAVLSTDVVTSSTGLSRAAVRFNCAAPSASIQGRYVLTNVATGSIDSADLFRPGSN